MLPLLPALTLPLVLMSLVPGAKPSALHGDPPLDDVAELGSRWLKALSLDQTPSGSHGQPIPGYMRTIYEHLDWADNEPDAELSEQLRGAVHNVQSVMGISPDRVLLHGNQQDRVSLTFSVNPDLRQKPIMRAELVLVRVHTELATRFRHLRAQMGLCADELCTQVSHLMPVQQHHLTSSNQMFDVFSVSQVYLEWVATTTPEENLSLLLEMNHNVLQLYDLNDSTSVQLVLYQNFPQDLRWPTAPSPPVSKRRSKRSPSTEEGNEHCHLVRWTFSFSQLNWDQWVVVPESFEANYCVGVCPEPLVDVSMPFTNHALLKSLYRTGDFPDAQQVPPTCCVPLRMSGISMLIRHNSSVVELKHLHEMKAESCGCV